MPAVTASARSSSRTPTPHRPQRAQLSTATWAVPASYLVITIFGMWWIDVRPGVVVEGFGDIARLMERMVPATTGPLPPLIALVFETLWIALAGTGIATLLSIPLAAAASRSFTGPRWVQIISRLVIMLTRAVPSLIFAIIFVRIFGLGPLAGALAIAVHSIGMIGKMMTDSFEELSPQPREAIQATGATRTQTFIATTLTRALPQMTSFVLYRLDINIRASAILGLVGAGGIGVALQTAIGSLNYPRAAGIIIVIILLLLALELVSFLSQRSLAEHADPSASSQLFVASRSGRDPGWSLQRFGRTAAALSAIGLFLFALSTLSIPFDRLQRSGANAWAMLSGFVPPTISTEVVLGIFESVIMALTATSFGVLIGLVIAILSTNHLVNIPALSWMLRTFVVLVRGVPDIIYALIFVAALGLGPFPGFLALSISCTALAAKFFTDALQNINPGPRRALEATGAGRVQAFVSGVWPQFVPSFIANSLFTSDLALRESAVLGIVGAGGVGFLLHESVTSIQYSTTAGILIGLVIVVVALEQVARWARRKVL
ncbi:phosphonate ABC transporter, permease protein PhnE [Citricoccus muralis]|uniref:Phosphonate ABC transporter, permease protein PhnE n=1 Tax=Citricoccus muralis TaxID=169134 RepID=A0ABY8H5L4_9MICC|nr:phosphonate ABC transporter, permease protein PhnE [Citricoccus muralis]WFP16241.1 phosphonate ABC transporter, permease protein PhnE [Citricoccus muralis]